MHHVLRKPEDSTEGHQPAHRTYPLHPFPHPSPARHLVRRQGLWRQACLATGAWRRGWNHAWATGSFLRLRKG